MKYQNPIIDRYLADPFILREKDVYYLFASHVAEDERQIPIYCSTDLVTWTFVRGAVTLGPTPDSWNRRNFWAPECYNIDGTYHLYYTGSPENTPKNTGNRVGLAVAHSPEGPYEDVGVVIEHASLDGSLFTDETGELYFYYAIEHENHDGLQAGQIYGVRMKDPRTPAGDPVQLISEFGWQEGPFVFKAGGVYFMTFSNGGWGDASYNVRYAVGPSALGPFKVQPGHILQSTDEVKGPGHHGIFPGPEGTPWLIYHGWDPDFKARYPRIDPLTVDGEVLSSIGPTHEPAPLHIQ